MSDPRTFMRQSRPPSSLSYSISPHQALSTPLHNVSQPRWAAPPAPSLEIETYKVPLTASYIAPMLSPDDDGEVGTGSPDFSQHPKRFSQPSQQAHAQIGSLFGGGLQQKQSRDHQLPHQQQTGQQQHLSQQQKYHQQQQYYMYLQHQQAGLFSGVRPHSSMPMVRSYFPPHKEVDPWFNPAFVTTTSRQQPKKGRGGKKADGKQPTFLTKLYAVLEQPEYHRIIRWDEAGEVIIIEQPEELAEKVLPLVYRQSRFASFSRQLNIYGWMRKVSLRHVESGIVDPDASTWAHPFLRRDSNKEQILSFKRRVPPRPSQAQKNAARHLIEGPTSTSSESENTLHSPPDAYHSHLLGNELERKSFSAHNIGVTGITSTRPPSSIAISAPHQRHSPMCVDTPTISPCDSNTSQAISMLGTLPSYGNIEAQPPLLFQSALKTSKDPSTLLPQSAPPLATNFDGVRVVQGHSRTRSVQGEPPSASLFSPTSSISPLATEMWLRDDHEGDDEVYDDEGDTSSGDNGADEDVLTEPLNINTLAPSYFPNDDPSTWARRGFVTLGQGMRQTPSTQEVSGVPGMLPLNMCNGPSSLPANLGCAFTPIGIHQSAMSIPSQQPSFIDPEAAAHAAHVHAHAHAPSSPSPSLNRGFNQFHSSPHADHPIQATVMRPAPVPIQPQTVSPGIYQSGFSLPVQSQQPWMSISSTRSLLLPSTPSSRVRVLPSMTESTRAPQTPTKPERRLVAATSPYSPPRVRAPPLSVPGSFRGVGGNVIIGGVGGELLAEMDEAQRRCQLRDFKFEDSLPSASLRDRQPELFGELEVEMNDPLC